MGQHRGTGWFAVIESSPANVAGRQIFLALRLNTNTPRFACPQCDATTVYEALEGVAKRRRGQGTYQSTLDKAHLTQASRNTIRTLDADNSSAVTRL